MYESDGFTNIYDLKEFLNINKIKPIQIIGIYRVPINQIQGRYELLYYVNEAKSMDEKATPCDTCIKNGRCILQSFDAAINDGIAYCNFKEEADG